MFLSLDLLLPEQVAALAEAHSTFQARVGCLSLRDDLKEDTLESVSPPLQGSNNPFPPIGNGYE